MASVGHIAVGLAAARVYTGRIAQPPAAGKMVFWSALSMLPDADVIGFPLGVRYADEWGHRGATHSLVFAAAVGIVAGLLAHWSAMRPGTRILYSSDRPRSGPSRAERGKRDWQPAEGLRGDTKRAEPFGWFRAPAFRTFVVATLVVASHSLLDTLTDGGLGCALFWPFDQTRYFARWRPIPVAPIGLGYLSPYGLYVACTELAIFFPLVWFALVWRRRTRGP